MASLSLTETVYRQLRADLTAGRLPPGQRLKIDDLCKRTSAGSSAVREALSRLVSDGFVAIEPRRGFRVAPLALEDLRDLTQTRCQIEALCIRNSITHGDIHWETTVVAASHRLSRTPVAAADDPARYSNDYAVAHRAFHETIVAACKSHWLLRLRASLYAQHERYRWLSRPLARMERDLDTEHRAIAEAAVRRDADRCVLLMEEHLHRTARVLLDAVET